MREIQSNGESKILRERVTEGKGKKTKSNRKKECEK